MRIKFISLFILLFIFSISGVFAGNFTSTWNTSAMSSGSSNNTTISLPLENGGDYDFVVYWGDGNVSNVTAWDSVNKTYTYGTSGIKTINIVGKLNGFRFNNGGDRQKLINITSWGGLRLGNSGDYFYGASNLKNITATDVNLSGTTDFSGMFRDNYLFNQDISGWDVSSVTDMSSMFSISIFNQDISGWDVSSVTDMSSMFLGAQEFNQDISGWDVSGVMDMVGMFQLAAAFNQDLSGWRVCHIGSEPNSFNTSASAWTEPKPKWGHPCVKNVSSVNSDGEYVKGNTINIIIEFSENVSVSGVPSLELEFSDGNKNATYSSGNGTGNLTFVYVIQDGDVASDLDYVDSRALKLGGGSINASDDGKEAVLTLPTKNSLSETKNISVLNFSNVFTSTWDTTKTSGSETNDTTIKLPLEDGGDYNFTVYWGDGSSGSVTVWNSTNATYNYGNGSGGVKVINVVGKLNGFRFNNGGDKHKLINITSWGGLLLGNNGSYFFGATNFVNIVGEVNLSGTTNFSRMFWSVTRFNGDIGDWDVSGVTDMSGMFYASNFNGNISGWDVSGVTDMSGMFRNSKFNQDIGDWNTSGVTDMSGMFYGWSLPIRTNFNQDIGDWDVSAVTNMGEMFRNSNFNQDIGDWDVGSVTDMGSMFYGVAFFNQDIGDWDVSDVTDMSGMFYAAQVFNQDIGDWDVSGVTDMVGMFVSTNINQDLTNWRVCQVTEYRLFRSVSILPIASQPKWGHPCVKNVFSNNADGSYGEGDLINVTVEFNDSVSVSGVPKLELEFLNGNKSASYVSGNGTTNLTFQYTIEKGDFSFDLDYNGIYSLKLDGGTINSTNYVNRDAVLTLPSKDTLAKKKNIFVQADAFVSSWDTSATSSGSSNNNQITLPLENGGDYNFVVYWGDGSSGRVTAWDDVDKTHTYSSAGNYTINISGKIHGFRFNNGGDKLKLINITSWSGLKLGNNGSYFYGAANLKDIVGDVNLNGTTDFSFMFASASKFNGDIGGWDVSGVTNMGEMFSGADVFNQDIGDWDVSGVIGMSGMFISSNAFNQDIGDWDVSGVTDMRSMFNSATAFNQDIGDWDVGSVTNMGNMFNTATAFNRDLSGWRVCQVTNRNGFNVSASAWTSANKPKFSHPCIRSFTATNGTYNKSDVINITMNFNEAVVVSGVPKLELDLGNATYITGNNTSSLTFNYSVVEGDVSSDLNWTGAGAVVLGVNGSINASDDNKTAVLTLPIGKKSLAGLFDVVVNATPEPTPPPASDSTTTTSSTGGSGSTTTGGSGGGGGGSSSSGSSSGGGGGGGGSGSGGSGGSGSSGGTGEKPKNETDIVKVNETNKDDEEMVIPIGKDEPKPKPEIKPDDNSWMIFLVVGGVVVLLVVLILVSKKLKEGNRKRMKGEVRRGRR